MKKPAGSPSTKRKLRCAVYTRKSSEEGLEQEFNSLDAQRESCEAYIASQRAEGWVLVPDRYDDGGYSGGTLERPALQRLIIDIESHRVDTVVVYKIDRLSRSLMDFAKLVEVFDRNGVTFVSVTQSFNTTTSMGRLTLNILLSFAQFEREVIGERIRDKFAASRRKGMWMGGWAPLGYDIKDRKLIVNEAEAKLVRSIFERFARLGSATQLVRELAGRKVVNKYGKPIDKGYLYKMLNNRVYLGEAVHKGTSYPGEHKATLDKRLWDRVHAVLKESPRKRAANTRAQTPALLKGLIFGPTGAAMTPTHSRRRGRLYRYYVSTKVLKQDASACPIKRIHVPLALHKRGGRKLVVSPGGVVLLPRRAQIDNTLIKAIARAFRWQKLLENGSYASIAEIARAEQINDSYVSRLLRLTLLAPEIVEAILDGRQAPRLQIAALLKPMPVEWEMQKAALEVLPRVARNRPDVRFTLDSRHRAEAI